jgi:predicted ATPase/transcriptional regulator with XRE-family HTH domain
VASPPLVADLSHPNETNMSSLASTATFGDLLKQLRKRSGMTQADLAAAVGYSVPFISNLELGQRLPDVQVVLQQFVPALGLQEESQLVVRLVELAAMARGERPPTSLTLQRETRLVLQEEWAVRPAAVPVPPTELIGRDQDVKTICNRLLGHNGRLLTLVGPPGIGKTRLALAVADKLQALYQDGVYFVPLAAINDAELVASTLVATLGIKDTGQRPPSLKLLEFLRRKELLLLLDNFEQIMAAAPLVAELLAACPGLRVLVTSRERLHLRAEQRYQVPPLELTPAVTLFVQRAQALDAEFALTPENHLILTRLCQHLDCLPLAIELSAARIDLFAPKELLVQLRDQRLDLLSDGPRDLPARQRTLRHAIQCSYALLNDQERQCFRILSVFVGGFEQTTTEALGVDARMLQSLLNKSLVQVATSNDEGRRFLLLETLREYAWEQLCAAGEDAATQRRHAEAYLRLAEEAAAHLRSADQAVWLQRLAVEHDNLRAALAWCLASQQPDLGARLGIALGRFWYIRGYYDEGGQWLQKLLAQVDHSQHRANLLYNQARLARRRGDLAAAADSFGASLALFRELGDQRGIASALRGLGIIHYLQDDSVRARPCFEEALTLFRTLDDQEGIAVTLDNLAYISNDAAEEQRLYQESLTLRRRSGNLHGITNSLAGLAYYAIGQEDYTTAQVYLQEHLQINEALGNQDGIANALWISSRVAFGKGDYIAMQELCKKVLHLGQVTGDRWTLAAGTLGLGITAIKGGEYDRAYTLLTQVLLMYQEFGHFHDITLVLSYLVSLAAAQGQAEHALRLAGAVTGLCESRQIQHLPLDQVEFDLAQATVRRLLSAEAAAAAWAAGQGMTVEQAIAYAVAQSKPEQETG